MKWLDRLFRHPPALSTEHALALTAYQSGLSIPESSPLGTLRFVVADVETTGLNPLADRLISIGAVTVVNRTVQLASGFEVVVRQTQASANANILIHGIDGTTQLAGLEPAPALLEFLGYAGKAPLVGFHADFDRVVIDRASKAALGCVPENVWLDLAYLAPALLAQPGKAVPQVLDEWMQRFGIENHARHNALTDALATAQLLQVVLARALATGAATLADLIRLEQDQRWLQRI